MRMPWKRFAFLDVILHKFKAALHGKESSKAALSQCRWKR